MFRLKIVDKLYLMSNFYALFCWRTAQLICENCHITIIFVPAERIMKIVHEISVFRQF